MAIGRQIRVMLSSRCTDRIPYKGSDHEFSDVRRELKRRIDSFKLLDGAQPFVCWINEDESAQDSSQDAWDACLKQAKDADIVLILYNGNAGWTAQAGEVGICHAELQTALSSGAARVRILHEKSPAFDDRTKGKHARETDKRMFKDVSTLNRFHGSFQTGEELIQQVFRALTDCLVALTRAAAREGRSGRYDFGPALDWSHLDFAARRDAMQRVMRDAIADRTGSRTDADRRFVRFEKHEILILCHAVPGAMGVATAREMVGMPFLQDHVHAEVLSGSVAGPVHLIGCHKGVTETQAMKLLGFPDATIVGTSFGVFVADNIQKIQILLLKNCRDETTTRHTVQRAFQWLEQSGEGAYLTTRAASRAKIVRAIAGEMKRSSSALKTR